MGNAVPTSRLISVTGLIDQSQLTRLCEEIENALLEHQDTSGFTFLYRYFQTLLQQGRGDEVQMFMEGMEQHPFKAYSDSVLTFVCYINAFLRKSQGKMKEAAYWFRQTLVRHGHLEALGLKNVQVNCYKELGSLDFYQERYSDAIENYQKAVNSLKIDADSEYLLAILMYNISLCQYYIKNYHQALEYLDKVIPLAKDSSNSFLLLNALILKSALLTDHFKNYPEANEILDQAYEIAERNQHTALMNKIWNNWGHNFFHLKQFMLAEQSLLQSIRLSRESEDVEAGLYSELLLAEIWIKQEREQEAKQLLERARKKAAAKPQYAKELLGCLELLKQVENDEKLRKKYIEEAYQLALEQQNYQKATKFQKELSKMTRKKKEF